MVKFGQEPPQNSIGANLLDVKPTHFGCSCGDAIPSTFAWVRMLYIHGSWSVSEKWWNTFLATFNLLAHLYWGPPQCTQWSTSTWTPLNNIHPLMHTSIMSYANPNFFSMCEVSYSELGDVLGVGSVLLFNNFINSNMKTLDVPCVQQQSKISNVAHKFDSLEFSYKGIFYASSNSTSLSPPFSSWSLNMAATSSCSMASSIPDILEYASTISSSMACLGCLPTFGPSSIMGSSFIKGLCWAPPLI